MKSLADQRTKNMKVIQDKMQLNKKEVKRFNPVSFMYNVLLSIVLLCYVY